MVVGPNLPTDPIRWVRFEIDLSFSTPSATRDVGMSEIQFTPVIPGNLITNASFNANQWNSKDPTSPDGWESVTPAGTPGPGNYGQAGGPEITQTLGLESIAAHLQDRGGNYYQQTLATDQGDVDAGTNASYNVTFDYAYRNDSTTAGDINLRVALWDTTDDSELVGETLTVLDPGVQAAPDCNQFATTTLTLDYDPTGLDGHSLAVRFTFEGTSAGDPGTQVWNGPQSCWTTSL